MIYFLLLYPLRPSHIAAGVELTESTTCYEAFDLISVQGRTPGEAKAKPHDIHYRWDRAQSVSYWLISVHESILTPNMRIGLPQVPFGRVRIPWDTLFASGEACDDGYQFKILIIQTNSDHFYRGRSFARTCTNRVNNAPCGCRIQTRCCSMYFISQNPTPV